MNRHYIGALLLLTALISVGGCAKIAEMLNSSSTESADSTTPATTEGTLPVTRRLCAIVQIGNLDQFSADATVPGDTNATNTDAGKTPESKTSEGADTSADADAASAIPATDAVPAGTEAPSKSKLTEESLSDILADPTLSEQEKDAKIQQLIDQNKAQLGTPKPANAEKEAAGKKAAGDSQQGESELNLDAMESLVPSDAMATTEEDVLLDIPVESVPNAANSTQNSEVTNAPAEPAITTAEPNATEGSAEPAEMSDIDALMNDTIQSALDDVEATAPKAEPAAQKAGTELKPVIDEELGKKSDLPNPADLPTEKSDIGAEEMNGLGLADIEAFCTEQAKEFLQINQNIPEEVKKEIKAAHFQNYSVWLGQSGSNDYYAVRYLEYTGSNFDLDYLTLIRSPNYRKWLRSQTKYLRLTGGLESRDNWLEMNELWHCD